MFEQLSGYFAGALERLRGRGHLTQADKDELLGGLRRHLLEADVALSVAKAFVARVEEQLGSEAFQKAISPRQFVEQTLRNELTALLGDEAAPLRTATPPEVIVMVGLQGVGKTTTAAKLAHHLQTRHKRAVAMASCDVYRPAAVKQLEVMAEQAGAVFYSNTATEPVDIATQAVQRARGEAVDTLIIDTAGRLHIDDQMMSEAAAICNATSPVEVLFVVDCMAGQDAAVSARAFHDTLSLTGLVLSKADSDARGGALLSVRHITELPVKLIGTGEKIDALEVFHPERMASRILGMGDIAGLVENLDVGADAKEGGKLLKKLKKKRGFTMDDMRKQLEQANKLGGLGGLLDKLPAAMSGRVDIGAAEREMKKTMAAIDSMTREERRRPDIMNGARKRRVAAGSGTQVQDINRVLKQFAQATKMMRKTAGMGEGGMMRALSGGMSAHGGMGGMGGMGGGGVGVTRKNKSKRNKRKKRRR